MNVKRFLTNEIIETIGQRLKDDGFDKEEIRRGIGRMTRILKILPDRFKVYRILKVENESKINKKELGVHWTLNKNILLIQHYYSEESHCIITAYATEKDIDFLETIIFNIKFPHEKEIQVKNMGKDLEIVSIKCGD